MRDVCAEVVNMQCDTFSVKAVWRAIRSVDAIHGTGAIPCTKYANCGRPRKLACRQELDVVAFVKKWRNTRFCTCSCIWSALKFKVTKRTVSNTFSRREYFWRALPKFRGLSEAELAKRKAWVERYVDKTPAWWQGHMGWVLDGESPHIILWPHII